MSTGSGRALAEGTASSLLAVLWYAMPDVVRSRGGRAVLKVGLVGTVGAYGAVSHARGAAREAAASDDGARGETAQRIRALTSTTPVLDGSALLPADDDRRTGPSTRRRAGIVGLAAAGVLGSVAGTVAVERALFRLGERRRAAGVRGPHARIGLVAGLVTAALSAATAELERRAATRD